MMGEMADWAFDEAMQHEAEEGLRLEDVRRKLNDTSDKDLVLQSASSTVHIVVEIRQFWAEKGFLTPKQKAVLASWILEEEERGL
jgi:hypothetical protein